MLAEELGVDPGPTVQALETAVLRQSDALWWQPADGGGLLPIEHPARQPSDGAATRRAAPGP